jgi:hypothetical protein
MSTISTIAATRNHTASRGQLPSPFLLCRDVELPRTGAIVPQLGAVLACYHRLTGLSLDTMAALHLLDQIRADRPECDPCSPRPIPAELAPIASFMAEAGYDRDAIYLTIREIERTGTAMLSVSLDGEDREAVEALIPSDVRSRGRFEAWA